MNPAAEVGSTANSYQILAKLATGGMAEIFLAKGASVGGVERYVVLKRILPERAIDTHFIKMFLDEARLAAQLQHPNIAQVYDIGRLGDSYFFTMEYVHGETVRSLLARGYALRKPLPLGCILAIAAQTAAGLHHAHERVGIDGKPLQIVHRDVSPSNLIASFEGNVKVVDFGVAKAAERIQETKAGTVKGKISYLSPEQCRGMPVDRRSDLFALGIVLWEMLTGERLYRREGDFAAMNAIVVEPPTRPSAIRADIPPPVDELVLKLLEKDPARRFQRGDELVEAIEECAMQCQVTLSITALGRLLREMFGQRPEPWQELRTMEAHPEVVTVTSEPVPAEIVNVRSDEVSQQLASVIDLAEHRARTSSQPSTAKMRPQSRISEPQLAPTPAIPREVEPESVSAPLPVAPSRPVWPIVAAILVAAVLGGGAVWLAMKTSENRTPVDAALVAITPPIDAMHIDAPTVEPTFVVDAPAPEPDAAAPAAPPPDAAMPDELTKCKSAMMTGARAVPCTIAACEAGDLANAKRWFPLIPTQAKKNAVEAKCLANKMNVNPPKRTPPPPRRDAGVAPDCKDDPFACQH